MKNAESVPLLDLWVALGRDRNDLDGYLADHGVVAVRDEMLRSVAFHAHRYEKAQIDGSGAPESRLHETSAPDGS